MSCPLNHVQRAPVVVKEGLSTYYYRTPYDAKANHPPRYPVPSLLGKVAFPEPSHWLWDHCLNIYPADQDIIGPAITWWNEQSWTDSINPTYGESCDCTPQPCHYTWKGTDNE